MNYIVLTSGRSGSTVINNYLKQLGVGYPQAWFDGTAPLYPVDPTIDKLKAFLETKRVNGILGLKFSWGSFFALRSKLKYKGNLKMFLDEVMPDAKFIYQKRRDRVHQAVSREKHVKVGTSHVRDEVGMHTYKTQEKQAMNGPIPVRQIKDRIWLLTKEAIAFDIFFEKHGIDPHILYFEDFLKDYKAALRGILDFLSLPSEKIEVEEIYKNTHSDLNEAWHDAMLSEYKRCF